MQKHQQLPENIEEILSECSRTDLEALLATHELDAREEVEGRTLLSFPDLPDDVLVRLVEQGLDVDTADQHGVTPLWQRAFENRAEQIPLLLSLGADVQAATPEGMTPLHVAAEGLALDAFRVLLEHGADPLARGSELYAEAGDPSVTPLGMAIAKTDTDPDEIVRLVEISERLLAAGDVITPEMRESIAGTGEEVEDHRGHWEPAEFERARTAMSRLYELFDVAPATARVLHDGVSPITAPPGPPEDQFYDLWRLLVPAMGPAATAQGEAVRLCQDFQDLVVTAWNEGEAPGFTRDHRLRAKALRKLLRSGSKLSRPERREAARSLAQILDEEAWESDPYRSVYDHEETLARLVVTWIRQNPTPLPVGRMTYEG